MSRDLQAAPALARELLDAAESEDGIDRGFVGEPRMLNGHWVSGFNSRRYVSTTTSWRRSRATAPLPCRSTRPAAVLPGELIEISVVGDAYGRPGGALQMVVLRPDPANPGEMEGVPLRGLGHLFKTDDWFAA